MIFVFLEKNKIRLGCFLKKKSSFFFLRCVLSNDFLVILLQEPSNEKNIGYTFFFPIESNRF